MRATYRLQLGPDLDFRAAARLVPYLRELGISHLCLSPSLQARAGSTHGYDVTDPRRVSEELGVSPGDGAMIRGLRPRVAERLLADPASEFATRFQQTTGAVQAEGVEDTAFYRYSRLLALNEVGGDPGRFSLSVEEFHRANAPPCRALPAQPARHADARHEALRRRALPPRRALVDP